MVTSNWRTVLENRKHMAEHVITMARLIQQDPHSPSRYRDALDLLQSAEDIIGDLIQDVQRDITEHEQKGEEMKAQQAKPNGSTSHEDAEEDDERGGIPRTPAGEAHLALRRTLFARLRECMILLHKVRLLFSNSSVAQN
jgi:E3 ubiquitin-protein ligase SHPRH